MTEWPPAMPPPPNCANRGTAELMSAGPFVAGLKYFCEIRLHFCCKDGFVMNYNSPKCSSEHSRVYALYHQASQGSRHENICTICKNLWPQLPRFPCIPCLFDLRAVKDATHNLDQPKLRLKGWFGDTCLDKKTWQLLSFKNGFVALWLCKNKQNLQ